MTMKATTPVHHIWNACNALYLEVHEDIANDIKRKLAEALDYMTQQKEQQFKDVLDWVTNDPKAVDVYYDDSLHLPKPIEELKQDFNKYLQNKSPQ